LQYHGRKVIVQDGNVERALRKFKKKIIQTGLLQELRERETYTKPATRRKVSQAKARARWKKHLLSQQLPKKNF